MTHMMHSKITMMTHMTGEGYLFMILDCGFHCRYWLSSFSFIFS